MIAPEAQDPTPSPGLLAEIRASFRGRMRWIVVLAWAYGFAFFGLALFSASAFFGAEATRDQILYATVFLSSVLFIAMIKLFYYGWLHRLAVLRELAGLRRELSAQNAPAARDA